MPNENKGWNDDEETIINFSARPKSARAGEEPPLTPPEDDMGLGTKATVTPEKDSRSAEPAFAVPAPVSLPEPELNSSAQETLIKQPLPKPEPPANATVPSVAAPVVQGPSIPAQPQPPVVPYVPPIPTPGQNMIDPPTRMDVPLIPPLEDPPTRQDPVREERPAPPPPVSPDSGDYMVTPHDVTNDKVNDVAFLVIMKTPSVRLHQMFRLDKEKMDIGRAFDTPIFLDDKTVSLRHAAVRYEQIGNKYEFVLYDLAALNGTYLNGAQVYRATLKDGDRISVGLTELVFKRV